MLVFLTFSRHEELGGGVKIVRYGLESYVAREIYGNIRLGSMKLIYYFNSAPEVPNTGNANGLTVPISP